jgi:hypothetical protein
MKNLAPLIFLVIVVAVSSCDPKKQRAIFTEQEVATKWADLTLFITRYTPGNSPTYASRALGYIGVTMYECVVPGMDQSKSLGGQLNDLGRMAAPDPALEYNWVLSLNAGQAEILRNLYNHTSDNNKKKIDSLESVIYDSFSAGLKTDVGERSVNFGKQIARQIFDWSVSDGGHRAYLKNFDKTFVVAHKDGGWKPPLTGQSFSRYPLHPHWGDNRTFIKDNGLLPIPACIPFSKSPDSHYYKQFLAVYEKSKNLTQKEKETALWWGDDPGETFTPPGHSYNMGTIVIRKVNPPLIKCAETYARIGIAVADAFINCWKVKYHYYSERPSTFVSENIDPAWEQFWPDPPFPAFPSGHATQAGSASTVLAALYGEEVTITDDSHVGHQRDELRNVDFKARSFTAFWQLAEEIADSRFYGGIHTDQDNLVGLDQGKKIGININHLNWTHVDNTKTIAGK